MYKEREKTKTAVLKQNQKERKEANKETAQIRVRTRSIKERIKGNQKSLINWPGSNWRNSQLSV